MERLDGKFYTTEKKESWGEMSYCIRVTTDRQLHLSFDPDSISFAGFMLEAERDRYFAEWTDEELAQRARLDPPALQHRRQEVEDEPLGANEQAQGRGTAPRRHTGYLMSKLLTTIHARLNQRVEPGAISAIDVTEFSGGQVDGMCLQFTTGSNFIQINRIGAAELLRVLDEWLDE